MTDGSHDSKMFDVLIRNVLRIKTLGDRHVKETRLMCVLDSERLRHRQVQTAIAALKTLAAQ